MKQESLRYYRNKLADYRYEEEMSCYRMLVKGLLLDPMTKTPVLILQAEDPKDDTIYLPIWIGAQEANAIVLAMENKLPPRPLTHDLLGNIIKELCCTIKRVVITRIENNIYYAEIELVDAGRKTCLIDSRPSDAVAVALRQNAPIFVEKRVIEKSKEDKLSGDQKEIERLKEWMNNSPPEDFGKYKM